MKDIQYGFRTGRFPVRAVSFPWGIAALVVLAALSWLWALAPWGGEKPASLPLSIAQSPTPGKEAIPSPTPVQTPSGSRDLTLSMEALSLYAVQVSAHTDEAAAKEALAASSLPGYVYRQGEKWKVLSGLYGTQAEAETAKAALEQEGREAYFFTWELPALQVELTAPEAEAALWEEAWRLLPLAAQAPLWAREPAAAYTAAGLADALEANANALTDAATLPQTKTLVETLRACAAALREDDLPSSAPRCSLAVYAYVTDALRQAEETT